MIKRLLIIPARSGSKRVKKKNYKLFLNKPIIFYSIDAALKSRLFNKIHVSTESSVIKKLIKKKNIETDFMRSKKLADDKTGLLDVINFVYNEYKNKNFYYDEIWCMSACSPLINSSDLIKISKISSYKKIVLTVREYSAPIEWALVLKRKNKIKFLNPEAIKIRSQDIKKKYHDAGSLIVIPKKFLEKKNFSIDGSSIAYILPKSRSIDIDDSEDWKIAEGLYRRAYEK
jgi:CMP-N-acetylneuraminic acid synthetase